MNLVNSVVILIASIVAISAGLNFDGIYGIIALGIGTGLFAETLSKFYKLGKNKKQEDNQQDNK